MKLTMNDWRRIFQEKIREAKPNDSWSLKMDQQLEFNRLGPGWAQVLQEHAHARFTCSQCHHSWSSHRVAILFHLSWGRQERRGWVRMRPFRQKCYKCSSERYEEAQFTETDVDGVVHRLTLDIREKCYREYVDRSELSEVLWDTEHDELQRPHCEACQMGLHRMHYGKPEAAVHHGRPQGAMQYAEPQRPVNFWTISNQITTVPLRQRSSFSASCCRCCAVVTCTGCLLVIVPTAIFVSKLLLGW